MKKLISLVTVLLAVAVIFCGCGTTGYSNGLSDLTGDVKSNGGFVVEKGDYVYFVNGVGAATDDNTYGKVTTGALVRVKKSDLVTASSATDLGDGKYYQSKTQMVIPSLFVAGDKTSGFWIFGNEVFYATPTTAQNKKGEVENTKLDFVKTSLTGDKSVKLKTVADNTTVYRFIEVGGKVYLVTKTVNSDSETVINVYNATDNKEAYTTAKIADCIFSEDTAAAEFWYTRAAYNKNEEKDEDFNELHKVVITADGVKDYIVLSGAGTFGMSGTSEGFGLLGAKFTLVKDTASTLYIKAEYLDKSVVTSSPYLAIEKSAEFTVVETSAAKDDADELKKVYVNNAKLVRVSENKSADDASSIFASSSIYVAKNAIVYIDSTYGIIKYDYTGADEASYKDSGDYSLNRTVLYYDENVTGYTARFVDGGYLYMTDSSSYYYRINLAAFVSMSGENKGATLLVNSANDAAGDNKVTVEKVNFLANKTDWYLPEVIDGKYMLSLYTADPYYSLVYVADIEANAALDDDVVETIRKSEKSSVKANVAKCVSYITSSMNDTIKTYFKDTFKD